MSAPRLSPISPVASAEMNGWLVAIAILIGLYIGLSREHHHASPSPSPPNDAPAPRAPVRASGAFHIHNNAGGDLEKFQETFDEAQREGRKIVISGFCYSACTLALAYGACVMPRAVLGYHAATEYGPNIPERYSPSGTAIILAATPPEIRQQLQPLTTQLQRIPASRIPARYWCSPPPTRQARQ
jgi:hypothetical protein